MPYGIEKFAFWHPKGKDPLNYLTEWRCSEDSVTKVLIVPLKLEYRGPHPPEKQGEAIYLDEENGVLCQVWMSLLYKCCDAALEQAIRILANNYCAWE